MLTEIRAVRHGSKQRMIVLDGEPWRLAPAEVVRETRLEVGDGSSREELTDRLAAVEGRMARDRAVRLLTYRDRSSVELINRLEEDGYQSETAAATAQRMCDLGLVNDERFAHALARTLARKGWGRSRARREMLSRGVEPSLADDALSETLPLDEELDSALTQARALCRRAGVTRERAAARLMRKGFAPRIAMDAARQAIDELPEAAHDDAWGEGDLRDGEPSS